MNDWQDDDERLAARVEDIVSDWYGTVERVPGDSSEPDAIVAKNGDQIVAVLPLDDETMESLRDAETDGELQEWLREELAEGEVADDEEDPGDGELDAAADAWLGASGLGAGGLGNATRMERSADSNLAADRVGDRGSDRATASGNGGFDGDDNSDDIDFDIDDWDDPEADALIDELPA